MGNWRPKKDPYNEAENLNIKAEELTILNLKKKGLDQALEWVKDMERHIGIFDLLEDRIRQIEKLEKQCIHNLFSPEKNLSKYAINPLKNDSYRKGYIAFCDYSYMLEWLRFKKQEFVNPEQKMNTKAELEFAKESEFDLTQRVLILELLMEERFFLQEKDMPNRLKKDYQKLISAITASSQEAVKKKESRLRELNGSKLTTKQKLPAIRQLMQVQKLFKEIGFKSISEKIDARIKEIEAY